MNEIFNKAKNIEPLISNEDARSLIENPSRYYSNNSKTNLKGNKMINIFASGIAVSAVLGLLSYNYFADNFSPDSNPVQTTPKQVIVNPPKANLSNLNNNSNTDFALVDNKSSKKEPSNITKTINDIEGTNFISLSPEEAQNLGLKYEGNNIVLAGLQNTDNPILITLTKDNINSKLNDESAKTIHSVSPTYITDKRGNKILSLHAFENATIVSNFSKNTNSDSSVSHQMETLLNLNRNENKNIIISTQTENSTDNLSELPKNFTMSFSVSNFGDSANTFMNIHPDSIKLRMYRFNELFKNNNQMFENLSNNPNLNIDFDNEDFKIDDINSYVNNILDSMFVVDSVNHRFTMNFNNLNKMNLDTAKLRKYALKLGKRNIDSLLKNRIKLGTTNSSKFYIKKYNLDENSTNKIKIVNSDENFKDEMPNMLVDSDGSMQINVVESNGSKLNIKTLNKNNQMQSNDIILNLPENATMSSRINSRNLPTDLESIAKINTLVPIGVGFKAGEIDYILWCDATTELAERLPAEIRDRLMPEIKALENKSTECKTSPVAGEPYLDVWKTCSGAVEALNAYPNPAREDINVNFNLNAERKVNISINDLFGNRIQLLDSDRIMQPGQHTEHFKLNSIPSGMYYIVVQTDKGEKTLQRIIIQ